MTFNIRCFIPHYIIMMSFDICIRIEPKGTLTRNLRCKKKWSLRNLKASTLVKPSQSRKKKTSYNAVTRGMHLKFFTAYYQTSLFRRGLFVLWGSWGERRRKRGGHSHHPPRAFYFFHYCYFYRDTPWVPLRRRELPDFYRWWGKLFAQQHCIMTIRFFGVFS